jgi:hypothetical protein
VPLRNSFCHRGPPLLGRLGVRGVLGERNDGVLGERNDGVLGERNEGVLGERNDGVLGERNEGVLGGLYERMDGMLGIDICADDVCSTISRKHTAATTPTTNLPHENLFNVVPIATLLMVDTTQPQNTQPGQNHRRPWIETPSRRLLPVTGIVKRARATLAIGAAA